MAAKHLFNFSIASALSQFALAEKFGNTYHPVISWDNPLHTDTWTNWQFWESSVPLKNRIVLAPNGN